MPEAARITDEVSHTSALLGLIAGAIAGALIGAAVAFTGGAAVLAIAAAAGSGASLGSMLGQFAGSFLSFTTGAITGICSPNVMIGGLLAARATADFSMCSGIIVSHPSSLIAQGSKTVQINGLPAARKTDKLVCGASISSGCDTVLIGDEGGTFLAIDSEVPAWLEYSMLALGLLSGAGLLRLGPKLAWLGVARVMGAGLLGSYVGGEGLGWLGGQIFGEGSKGQKIMGFVGSLLGGAVAGGLAMRGAPRLPRGPPPPDPATVARTGEPSVPGPRSIARPNEVPYRNPPEMHRVAPGEPPPNLDPNKKYLWVVDNDGNVLIAPEDQSGFGRVVKHGDLTPAPDGTSRGPARTGGELVHNPDTGKWEMNNDSSYAHHRADGNVGTPDNLNAAKDLMQQGGMDTSNIETKDILR